MRELLVRSRFGRITAQLEIGALILTLMPLQSFGEWVRGLHLAARSNQKPLVSHKLSTEELHTLRGRDAENPYISGKQKWAVDYNGVDLATGNFSFSATDLSFEGGYGIPINLTRTYSANNPDDGPFGKGWSMSGDIRTTAGGILKGAASPVRSVATEAQERPIGTVDERNQSPAQNQTTEGIIVTDSGAMTETIQRDVDGILTTPPWDKNQTDCTYEVITNADGTFWITKDMTVTTPEGTVYTYAKKGYYTNGALPPNSDTGMRTPSNILKVTSVTDRHGNTTSYTYDSSEYDFNREQGSVKENPLTEITAPNGYTITLTWYEPVTGKHRVHYVSDGTRTVTYSYNSNADLSSVSTPGGLTTSFTYYDGTYGNSIDDPDNYGVGVGALLKTITDPRGLVTTIHYSIALTHVPPYMSFSPMYCVTVWQIDHPNDTHTYYRIGPIPSSENPSWDQAPADMTYLFQDRVDNKTGELINAGGIIISTDTSELVPVFEVDVFDAMVAYGPHDDHSELPSPMLSWGKRYNALSQDLVDEVHNTYPYESGDKRTERFLEAAYWTYQSVETETKYNFRGNPLEKTVTETSYYGSGSSPATVEKSYVTEYAYHGASKYYQQKAVKDPKGRFTYTDYYDDSATQGKKGQVYRVYDPKNSTFDNTGSGWKDNIVPHDTSKYTAQFDYDSKGRPIEVRKLQDTSSTWFYTITQTEYGADGSGYWGNPVSVVEDVDQPGIGYTGIKRETQTLSYDSAGRATSVEDAAGKVFETTYNLDGQVLQIVETDTSPDITVATYQYGNSGINNGMLTRASDNLSGIKDDYTYTSSGGGIGQVATVIEQPISALGNVTTVSYYYTSAGDRDYVTYDTPYSHSTTNDLPKARWKYLDYVRVGSPDAPKRVFQTLRKQEENGDDTTEEMHYQFDSAGKLTHAVFMQSPQSGQSSYSATYPALYRAHSYYVYDPSGRILDLQHAFETYDSSNVGYMYDSVCLKRFAYWNDSTHAMYYDNGGLRTRMDVYDGSGTSWSLNRSEYYSYDSALDYLTEADYNDGGPNEHTTWSYDAAGNRISDSAQPGSWSYDALNRMTASPGHTYQNDILGNRTWRDYGSGTTDVRYTWDIINRLKTCCNETTGATYTYRADGMRIKKIDGLTIHWNPADEYHASGWYDDNQAVNKDTTRYYYDGQMGMEEDRGYTTISGTHVDVTRYGLGPRGIERMELFTDASSQSVTFPLYDGHGNMIATLARNSSSPHYTSANSRSYDAWGGIRSGSATGDPAQRYCANLGHRVDDESGGLIYMRARYYEPWTGRFVSEDPAHERANWYLYCGNNPVTGIDSTGKDGWREWFANVLNNIIAFWSFFGPWLGGGPPEGPDALPDKPIDVLRGLEREKKSVEDVDPENYVLYEYLVYSAALAVELGALALLAKEIVVTATAANAATRVAADVLIGG